jgi:hypothetical protein
LRIFSHFQPEVLQDILDYAFIAQVVLQEFSRFPVVEPTTRQATWEFGEHLGHSGEIKAQ